MSFSKEFKCQLLFRISLSQNRETEGSLVLFFEKFLQFFMDSCLLTDFSKFLQIFMVSCELLQIIMDS